MKSNKGVTIIEGVIASALLALALGGILSLFTQSYRVAKLVDYAYISINLAKNEVERIRELRREQGLEVLSSSSEPDVCIINRVGESDPNGNFERTTVITNHGSHLVKVTVSVDYKIRGKWAHKDLGREPVELVTVVSPYL